MGRRLPVMRRSMDGVAAVGLSFFPGCSSVIVMADHDLSRAPRRSGARAPGRLDGDLLPPRKPLDLAIRRPRKISVTIPQAVYETLRQQSERQGRSLSSLASYWLQVQASRGDGPTGRDSF